MACLWIENRARLSQELLVMLGRLLSFITIYSLVIGVMKAVKARVSFQLSSSLILGVWIPFKNELVWIEFKYERFPHFCYGCCKITHETKFCSFAKEMCTGFGRKMLRLVSAYVLR